MVLVGHGHFGLRDDLRIFEQLKNESAARTDAFVEIEGGALIEDTWSGTFPGFEYSWSQEFDGEALEVSTVRTLAFPTLTRVETLAQMQATEGTWQYDARGGTLRVHLPGDFDPSGSGVLVTTAFNFGTAGDQREHLVQPYLGTDLVLDGDFNDVSLSDWTVTTTGSGFSATVDTPSPPLLESSSQCLVLAGTGSGSGSVSVRQVPDSVEDGRYRYFGYYRVHAC